MEEWKKIDNYENYSVSNRGQVRNDNTGRILKQNGVRNGYSQVTLSKDGKIKTYYTHRLVMNAFMPNPDPKKYTDVNHKDYNKNNNTIENLEWTSHADNIKWGSAPNDIVMIAEEIKNAVVGILMKYTDERNSENLGEKLKNSSINSLIYQQR